MVEVGGGGRSIAEEREEREGLRAKRVIRGLYRSR